jgi:hypothetical protein
MKNFKLPVLISGLMLLAASCRKDDFKSEIPAVPAEQNVTTEKWTALGNWSSSQAEKTTTYFTSIPDSAITADIAKAGMVLVYKKVGATVQSLPLQDGNVSWHYQVSNGSIRINSENNIESNLSEALFSYFVITPGKLTQLEAAGKTKLDLLDLPYDQAVAILK